MITAMALGAVWLLSLVMVVAMGPGRQSLLARYGSCHGGGGSVAKSTIFRVTLKLPSKPVTLYWVRR
jgi:hypothetical protein